MKKCPLSNVKSDKPFCQQTFKSDFISLESVRSTERLAPFAS